MATIRSTKTALSRSIIENGYAFEDRYDIAMSKNNNTVR
ncbi:MAG: glycoside hydrolase family 70 protein [Streptococcus sp.]